MDNNKPSKAISTSTPTFSIRYNAEDEEVEQLYDSPKIGETHSDNSSPLSTPLSEKKNKDSLSKASKRSGSLEDAGSGEPWRLLTEIRGRITKTVEEKIEEIHRKKKKKEKLKSHSSLSDSEEKSEPSQLDSSSPEKSTSELITTTEKLEETADSDLGDVSDTEVSLSSDRATTPVASEVNLIPGFDSKDLSSSSFGEKKKMSAVFRNRKAKSHRRKVSKSDEIELAVEAMEEVEKNGTTESSLMQDTVKSVKYQMVLQRKKVATSFIAALIAFLLAVTYLYDVPAFVVGLLVGILVCFLFVCWTDYLFDWVCETRPEFLYLHGYYQYFNTPFLSENMISFEKGKPEESLYTGWMNEFPYEYKPDIYHISQTETVLVTLVGSTLTLGTPRGKIPKKAVWNEPEHKSLIDVERIYDINNCTVSLLPEGLVQKRLWSKKYPICIKLLPHSYRGTKFRDRGDKDPVEEVKSSSPTPQTPRESTPTKENAEYPDDSERTSKDDFEPAASTPLPKCSSSTNEDDDEDEEEEEDDDVKDYVQVPSSLDFKNNLYLFARTDREKDLWFRRLVVAAGCNSWSEPVEENLKEIDERMKENQEKRKNLHENYLEYMKQIGHMTLVEDPQILGTFDNSNDQNFLWLNLFIARVLYDPMKNPYWVGLIHTKIQRKLSVIKVPTFMERFVLSNIEFNKSVPTLEKSKKPKMNEDGLWVELDVSYQGVCKMTIDTKINLMKMKNLASRDPDFLATQEKSTKSAYLDSSQEDSAESSCEEDEDPKKPSKPNKALMVIDKIAASKMFQQVTDNKLVKKAMENVANTTISLYVEVKSLVGTVVLNIPPPPSDRLWYGFKSNTKLHLTAKPRVGDRGINMTYITGIIEKKLYREFQKILVMPNMDDLLIPIMTREKPY